MNFLFLLLLFFIPNEIYAQNDTFNALQGKCNDTDYSKCEIQFSSCASYRKVCPCIYSWSECLKEANCWNNKERDYLIKPCEVNDCTCKQCPWMCSSPKTDGLVVFLLIMAVIVIVGIAMTFYICFMIKRNRNYIRINN